MLTSPGKLHMTTEVSFKVYKNIPPMNRERYEVGSNQAIYNTLRSEIKEKNG